VCLSNQTSIVGVLRADLMESGCYVADLATVAERLSLPRLPISCRLHPLACGGSYGKIKHSKKSTNVTKPNGSRQGLPLAHLPIHQDL
jgi:hypothetical protein